jgi:hypothetical protein
MISARADTRALDALASNLRGAEPRLRDGQRQELAAIAQDIALDASLYPPQPAGSAYVRTYTLEQGWGVEGPSGSTTLEAAAVNAVSYAEYVMGEGQAASASHWRTTATIAAQWEAQAAERLAARAQRDLEASL